MHTGKRYTAFEFFYWTRRHTYLLFFISCVPTILYFFGWRFLSIPWQPIAILGTVVAFVVGLKNNSSYGRIWEARQIYGGIINDSRSFAYTVRDLLGGKTDPTVVKIFYRHIAWLTVLRYQLREPRTWENMDHISNKEYLRKYDIPERQIKLEEVLLPLLSEPEYKYIFTKKNKATQLTALQSEQIAQLYKDGKLNDFEWKQLQECLVKFTDGQGKAERIKNFPYPRNFASVTTYLLFIFVLLVPFGLLNEFNKLGNETFLQDYTLWLNIPFCTMTMWAFVTLDVVGESAVNPFEGSSLDVPITQISRTIEIDMRDMLDEVDLPPAILPHNNIVL